MIAALSIVLMIAGQPDQHHDTWIDCWIAGEQSGQAFVCMGRVV